MNSLLPMDASLPALARLFETDSMLTELAPDGDDYDCDIERIKYRPNRNCVVAYRLSRARQAPLRLAVCMYRSDEVADRFRKASSIDATARLLPSMNAVVWSFPHDRKLPSLPLLVDPAQAEERWLRPLVRSYKRRQQLVSVDCDVVSFFPEHGATVRARLHLANRAGQRSHWDVYGQTRYDDDAARAYIVMEALRDDARRTGTPMFSARALSYDVERRVLWQEAIGAPTLADQLDANAAVDWRAVAGVLGRTQANKLRLPRERSLDQLLASMATTVATVARAVPDHAERCHELQRKLLRSIPGCNPGNAIVHGDLHSKNILTRGHRAWLIDFDRVACGDPLADVASLAAELLYRDCVANRLLRWGRVIKLLEAYRSAVPWLANHKSLAWHVAAALLRERVYRAVTSLKPGRIAAIPRLLDAAEQALERQAWT